MPSARLSSHPISESVREGLLELSRTALAKAFERDTFATMQGRFRVPNALRGLFLIAVLLSLATPAEAATTS
jgi:hypothetical protein